jgi:hypothetical protein
MQFVSSVTWAIGGGAAVRVSSSLFSYIFDRAIKILNTEYIWRNDVHLPCTLNLQPLETRQVMSVDDFRQVGASKLTGMTSPFDSQSPLWPRNAVNLTYGRRLWRLYIEASRAGTMGITSFSKSWSQRSPTRSVCTSPFVTLMDCGPRHSSRKLLRHASTCIC